jgi:hypothetical protein
MLKVYRQCQNKFKVILWEDWKYFFGEESRLIRKKGKEMMETAMSIIGSSYEEQNEEEENQEEEQSEERKQDKKSLIIQKFNAIQKTFKI